MSFLDTFLTLYLNLTNCGEHFSEVFGHVQRGSSKFKALEELSLAIKLFIQWAFHGLPLHFEFSYCEEKFDSWNYFV